MYIFCIGKLSLVVDPCTFICGALIFRSCFYLELGLSKRSNIRLCGCHLSPVMDGFSRKTTMPCQCFLIGMESLLIGIDSHGKGFPQAQFRSLRARSIMYTKSNKWRHLNFKIGSSSSIVWSIGVATSAAYVFWGMLLVGSINLIKHVVQFEANQ